MNAIGSSKTISPRVLREREQPNTREWSDVCQQYVDAQAMLPKLEATLDDAVTPLKFERTVLHRYTAMCLQHFGASALARPEQLVEITFVR
jgi:hypothetical protein